MNDFVPCVVVPTFDNPGTVRSVVERARELVPEVVLVDDGSGKEGRLLAQRIAREGLAHVVRRGRNGGKGAAVHDGLRRAADLGFTHALQIDADGQHDLSDIPRFLEAAKARPEALILGQPIFDEAAPRSRVVGRLVTRFWTTIETGGRVIADALCGFRVYPIRAALAARPRSRRMEYDVEIAVRMYWAGTPIVNLPTRVRYLPREMGGVSHYRLVRDNVLMSRTHAVLATEAPFRLLARAARKKAR